MDVGIIIKTTDDHNNDRYGILFNLSIRVSFNLICITFCLDGTVIIFFNVYKKETLVTRKYFLLLPFLSLAGLQERMERKTQQSLHIFFVSSIQTPQ